MRLLIDVVGDNCTTCPSLAFTRVLMYALAVSLTTEALEVAGSKNKVFSGMALLAVTH